MTMYLSYIKGLRRGRRAFMQLPCNGQKTRSNGRHSNKNNFFLIKYVTNIYVKYFSFVYPVNSRVFFRAQEVNKLFILNWSEDWYHSRLKAFKLVPKKSNKISFNLEKASLGQTVGYDRVGAASKRGKARSKITSVSIGMPMNMVEAFVFNNNNTQLKYTSTTK